ncbi:Fis family transcriptional regulator [Phytophthora palmivora]|uniref:Fis family transcriptional regulator n=1 Tax=Phytophthora palmivora TaxID=4796 RepID=A0A2P4X455_9STRA|nr:Fis family transcriptional regulator [Phytophthora palmivora]
MVDMGMVRGMMLTKREQDVKTKNRKSYEKKLSRATKEPRQVVYADLLFPGKSNKTRFDAVRVIIDGFSRYITVYLLLDKPASMVNRLMNEYTLWAERQAGRNKIKIPG